MKHQRTKAQDMTTLMPLKKSGQKAVQALPAKRRCPTCVGDERSQSPWLPAMPVSSASPRGLPTEKGSAMAGWGGGGQAHSPLLWA